MIPALLVALSLAAPGDTLIRTNLGKTVPNKDDKVGPVLSCPFTTPGDYATGTTSLCTPATALTVTRSSSATYENPPGTLVTATANRLRVDADGAVIETAVTNQCINSANLIAPGSGYGCSSTTFANSAGNSASTMGDVVTAPDGTLSAEKFTHTGSVAYPGSGQYSTWNTGTGFIPNGTTFVVSWYGKALTSSTMSIAHYECDTLGCDGAACTINSTSWTRCSFTRTATSASGGNVNIGFHSSWAGFSGTAEYYVWGLQVEYAPTATSYIATTGTAAARTADAVSVANPLTTNPLSICAGTTATPYGGRSWSRAGALLSTGTDAAADAWSLRINASANVLFDADQKIATWASGYTTGTHTLLAGTATGTLSLSSDGSPVTPTISGAGDGIVGTQAATLRLGVGSAANTEWNGAMKNVKIYNVPCAKAR